MTDKELKQKRGKLFTILDNAVLDPNYTAEEILDDLTSLGVRIVDVNSDLVVSHPHLAGYARHYPLRGE